MSKSRGSSDRHRWMVGILFFVLMVAATVRLTQLDQVPPGLHADEAANAWNAYTVLKTRKDQHGIAWPIFYTRAFGENRSPSYIYALLPFQALGGLNVWTTRLPAAVGGIISVLLIYLVGMRLFDPWTGVVAAGIFAVNPWHVQTSRYAFEAALVPLLIMTTSAVLLWANLPLDDAEKRTPRPLLAALAGAVAGISCYGYWAVRIFLPIFFFGVVLATWKDWRARLASRRGAKAVGAFLIAFAVTFGPLVWKHLTDPEIGKRGQTVSWVWSESDTVSEKAQKVLDRYLGHFGPDFLFVTGDGDAALSPPPGFGLFHWYELPLMLLGLATCALRFKSSQATKVLLVWLGLYPVPDLLFSHVSLNSLRSLPGLPAFVLLEAVGAVSAGRWLWQRQRDAAIALCSGMAVAMLISNALFLQRFFGDFRHQKEKVPIFGADILEAARWLRPKFSSVDAVFVTGLAVHPYIFTLVGLDYDPKQWFRDVREIIPGPLPNGTYRNEDVYLRYGKMHFLHTESSLGAVKELSQNGHPDHVVFVLRPGELDLDKYARPVHEIRNLEGQPVLWIFDLYL